MILALKLLLTPFFIAIVTLAGRKWGPTASGLLIGLPLTSGPISIILALQYGTAFAAHAGIGNIAGQASVCIFCLAYSLSAQRMNWFYSTLVSITVFLMATFFWNRFALSLFPTFGALLVIIVLVLRLIPKNEVLMQLSHPPVWDIPARMGMATTFVILLTTFADALGPQLSGLFSPFPVFGNVIAAFTHSQQGSDAAAKLLRGVVTGSVSFGCFFLIVSGLLQVLGIGWTYTIAALVAVGINGSSYLLTRKNGVGRKSEG